MRRREFSGCAELCSGCVANPTDVYVDALLRNDAAPAPSPQASAGNLFATRAELGRLMASGTRSPSMLLFSGNVEARQACRAS